MANLMTRELRASIIEQNKLDIPYDADEFVTWLSKDMPKDKALRQVELIRIGDIELWSPGDPELFNLIAEWIKEGENAPINIRILLNDFVISAISGHIEYLEELRNDVTPKSEKLLNDLIDAYVRYRSFMCHSLEHSESETFVIDNSSEQPDQRVPRYPKLPLDDEFKQYLDDSKYPRSTRDKMLSNLRKFNYVVINNGRGDSNWLHEIYQRASQGQNINSARMTAYTIFHKVLNTVEHFDISKAGLSGAYSSLNAYIRFIIDTTKKSGKERHN